MGFFSTYILFIALLIATFTDLEKRTIPIWLFPSALAVCMLSDILCGNMPGATNLLGFAAMLLTSFYGCMKGHMGGGDLIMFSVLGFVMGIYALIPFTIFMWFVELSIRFIKWVRKQECRELPLAPLALAAYTMYLINFLWRK